MEINIVLPTFYVFPCVPIPSPESFRLFSNLDVETTSFSDMLTCLAAFIHRRISEFQGQASYQSSLDAFPSASEPPKMYAKTPSPSSSCCCCCCCSEGGPPQPLILVYGCVRSEAVAFGSSREGGGGRQEFYWCEKGREDGVTDGNGCPTEQNPQASVRASLHGSWR